MHGRALPWREVVNRPALVGDLRIEELREDELHRCVRTATLWGDMEILHRAERPTLYDVRIIAMTPQALPSTAARKKRSKRAAPS